MRQKCSPPSPVTLEEPRTVLTAPRPGWPDARCSLDMAISILILPLKKLGIYEDLQGNMTMLAVYLK